METAIYIVQDNPVRALSFVDELEATCLGLGQTADIGAARPELGDGMGYACFRMAAISFSTENSSP